VKTKKRPHIVAIAIFALVLVGCPGDSSDSGTGDTPGKGTNPFIGTWKSSIGYVVITFRYDLTVTLDFGIITHSGTYTWSENSAVLTYSPVGTSSQVFSSSVVLTSDTTLVYDNVICTKQ